MIKQLFYRSRSLPQRDGRASLSMLRDIMKTSRARNHAAGVTGYLLFDREHFAQMLEGEPSQVDATLARIGADRRHRDLTVPATRQAALREFPDWTMGGSMPGSLEEREILLSHGLAAKNWVAQLDPTRFRAVCFDLAAVRSAAARTAA